MFHLNRCAGDCLDILHQLRMVMSVRVVVDTRIDLFRHDTHLVEGIHEGMREATLADIATSPTHIIVLHLVHVLLAHDEHLRKIIRAFAHTQQFRLHKGDCRKAPTGTRRGLILHWRSRHPTHIRKLITLSGGGHRPSCQQA